MCIISLYSAGVYCNLRLVLIYRWADLLNLVYVICVYTRSSTPYVSSSGARGTEGTTAVLYCSLGYEKSRLLELLAFDE
jgi:hypothetical protein